MRDSIDIVPVRGQVHDHAHVHIRDLVLDRDLGVDRLLLRVLHAHVRIRNHDDVPQVESDVAHQADPEREVEVEVEVARRKETEVLLLRSTPKAKAEKKHQSNIARNKYSLLQETRRLCRILNESM